MLHLCHFPLACLSQHASVQPVTFNISHSGICGAGAWRRGSSHPTHGGLPSRSQSQASPEFKTKEARMKAVPNHWAGTKVTEEPGFIDQDSKKEQQAKRKQDESM